MTTITNIKTVPQPHGFTLNGCKLSLRFHGKIVAQDLPEYIPLQICIQVDDKWAGLLSAARITLEDKSLQNRLPAIFSFLPLPQGFEPSSTHEWYQLAKDIERDLLAEPHLSSTDPECYFIMRELFWMAFIAAFPSFPHGNWPVWNAEIPMEGDFVSRWALKDPDVADYEDDFEVNVARQLIWEQFLTTVRRASLFLAT